MTMSKKRGKKSKKVLSRAAKKTIKSGFQEKEVRYVDVKNSVSPSNDPKLDKQLSELADHKYYGQRTGEKSDKPLEKEVENPKNIFLKRTYDNKVPTWFYMASIFAAFLFTAYISIFATIHFEDISNMNIMIVFLFLSMVSYFLISAIFFISEKKRWHAAAPILFFVGIVAIMIYAFKAINTADLVRYSIIYTIIVTAVSAYVLAIRRQ